MTPYEMGDLRTGRTLDVASQLLRRHFKDLLKIHLYFFIPVSLVFYLVLAYLDSSNTVSGAVQNLRNMLENMEAAAPGADEMARKMISMVLSLLFSGIMLLFVMPVTVATSIYYFASRYLGREADPRSSLRRSFKKFGHVLLCSVLYWVIKIAAALALAAPLVISLVVALISGNKFMVVPGAILTLALLVPYYYFSVRYWLCLPVVMVEDVHDIAAFRRSSFLTRDRIRRGIGLNILAGIVIGGLVQGGAALVTTPLWLNVLLITVGEAVTYSYVYAVLIVYYFNCRCLHENFDISYLARLGLPPEANETAAPAAEGTASDA